MLKKTLIVALSLFALAASTAWAQPPGSGPFGGDEGFRGAGWRANRMARLAEYLDLSESQIAEWQAVQDQHFEGVPDRLEVSSNVADWREEFRALAAEETPDLELLGRLALDIHRAQESFRESRQQLTDELERILTPEQAEKFEALEAARDISGHRGRRSARHRRTSTDSN